MRILSYYSWLCTLVVFAILIDILVRNVDKRAIFDFYSQLILLNGAIGIVTFVLFILTLKRRKISLKSKKVSKGFLLHLGLSFVFLTILIFLVLRIVSNYQVNLGKTYLLTGKKDLADKAFINAKTLLLSTVYENSEMTNIDNLISEVRFPSPTPTEIPNNTPTNTPIVSSVKNNFQNNTANTENDPIIDCKFAYLGTMKLKSSVCSKSTDCQIGGKWVYYDSVEKCKHDQQIEYEQWTKNNPFNTLAPWPTSAPYVAPTYEPVVQPTSDPRCSQAYNMWLEYRKGYLENQDNMNYGNSAEKMVDFLNEKKRVQDMINSYGCNLNLK